MPARSEVVRVDVDSGQVSDHVPVGGAGVVAVSDQAVWSAGVPGNAIDQIDPDAGTVVRTIGLGTARVSALAFGSDALWVADALNDAVIELETTAGLVKRRMPLPLKPTAMIVDGESLVGRRLHQRRSRPSGSGIRTDRRQAPCGRRSDCTCAGVRCAVGGELPGLDGVADQP